MTTGDRLRLEREKKGWTQLQAAEILGISNAALSNYERDVRQPDYDMLRRFARIFGTSIDYLLGYSTARRANPSGQPKPESEPFGVPLLPIYRIPLDADSPFNPDHQIGVMPHITGDDPESYFYVKCGGEYKSLAFIDSGDLLLCRRQSSIASGAVMLAQTESDPVIVARFYEDHHRFIILSENASQPPKILQKKDVIILGRVIAGVHYYL